MDPRDPFRAQARYNRWMNARLYATAALLSDEERGRDLGAFFRSVHGTLNHLVLTDRYWLRRFTGDPRLYESRDAEGRTIEIRGLDQILYEDFADLSRERARTDADIVTWVEGLTPEALMEPMRYRTSAGVEYAHPRWPALAHFFNHQTHHRGQVTALLTRLGKDPGVTDMIAFLRDEGF